MLQCKNYINEEKNTYYRNHQYNIYTILIYFKQYMHIHQTPYHCILALQIWGALEYLNFCISTLSSVPNSSYNLHFIVCTVLYNTYFIKTINTTFIPYLSYTAIWNTIPIKKCGTIKKVGIQFFTFNLIVGSLYNSIGSVYMNSKLFRFLQSE